MFLKSLEIRGFKSFADKTEIVFKKGITSIVGPNGSGKSNVSDAVRWVLGEQSVKTLRGGKMEDVIFAGTQFRKSLGVCQVVLTLDNSDNMLPIEYSDVTVSRRLYRSGESEYFINNTLCRLRDIQELFMDTGIGKEGYSIIGQGKIEAVLSGKPEERRGLIEEAAGIVKFKARKEEAEKKLLNTEQNLIRINDILSTFEERLEPLRIESEKAKEFIRLSEELKGKDINIIIHYIDSLNEKMLNIKENIKNINSETILLKEEYEKYKVESDLWNKKNEDFELTFSQRKKKYYDSKSLYQNIEMEISLSKERVINLQNIIERNLGELNDLDRKIKLLISNKEKQESDLEKIRNQQIEINSFIVNKEKEIAKNNLAINDEERLIKELKENQIEFLSYSANLKNLVNNLNDEVDSLQKKLLQIKGSREGFLNSIKINSSTKLMLESSISEINDKVKSYQEGILKNKQKISQLNNEIFDKEKRLKELNNQHSKFIANKQMLINLDKQYEGYNRSVKILMQDINKGKINGAHRNCFVLGEVIEVKKDLEVAVEIALGGAISDIITNNEEIAKRLISYLKENKLGRATFLPLTTIKGKKLSSVEDISKLKGYVGVASELISYDNKFSNAIEFILGRTIISEDMDSALNIAKKSNYSYKIVTLSGEVVNPGGSLTGGSLPHKNTNIISRKREIDDLSHKIQNAQIEIDSYTEGISKDKLLVKSMDDESLNYRDYIYNENIEITKIQNKIANIEEENSKLKNNFNAAKNEIEMIEIKLKENSEEFLIKEEELLNLSQKERLNVEKINELEILLKEEYKKAEETKEQLIELKIKKAQIDEIVSNGIKELERYDKEIDEFKHKAIQYKLEADNSEKNMREEENNRELNSKKLLEINNNIIVFEEEFEKLEIERVEIKEKIKNVSNRIEQLKEILSMKENDIHKYEVSMAKYETETEAHYEKLNNEIGITYAEALKYKAPIENMDGYKQNIAKLKNCIAALGVVNVGAVEEYKEIKEKHSFMNAQKEDLTSAINELESVISEMTNNMKTVFAENFQKLRENFNETFRELFKGGSADLILSDGDELSGNIDITVQPPGKKLQNINLMSGGEKGLSAIALLFAILKMKPTPFCLLDEIEAALDDANVFRYSEFLKKFSCNTQFIVITHRKGTMEASDALYGVTMEEKGVSKVVSVDLSK